MNWFGQSTTTLSSRHTVKMAWLRIAQTAPGLSTASCRAPVLRHRHLRRRDHGLETESDAPGSGTAIYACNRGQETNLGTQTTARNLAGQWHLNPAARGTGDTDKGTNAADWASGDTAPRAPISDIKAPGGKNAHLETKEEWHLPFCGANSRGQGSHNPEWKGHAHHPTWAKPLRCSQLSNGPTSPLGGRENKVRSLLHFSADNKMIINEGFPNTCLTGEGWEALWGQNTIWAGEWLLYWHPGLFSAYESSTTCN